MCLQCFEEDYTVVPTSPKIERAVKLIKELYNTDEGGAGGYGHIVFDDWNLESIDFCLNEALNGNQLSEETKTASIKALRYCKKLTENELANALRLIEIESNTYNNERTAT